MRRTHTALILSLNFLFVGTEIHAAAKDSLSIKKNLIELKFLGNDYIPPFFPEVKITSPLSINYSRILVSNDFGWEFSVGLSTFRSYYHDNAPPYTARKPWALCTPIGFLWTYPYKRNGFWIGASFTPAFVKQQYLTGGGHSIPSVLHTLNYDYDIIPELCYQFRSLKGSLACKIFYAPKISSAFFNKKEVYEWKVVPFWGGISIEGAW